MPTSPQSQEERRLDAIERKMEKYDEIISDLRTIVLSLKSRSDANQKWFATMLTLGATVVGAILGALSVHLVR